MNKMFKVFFSLVTLFFLIFTIASVVYQEWLALIFFVIVTISSYVFYRAF